MEPIFQTHCCLMWSYIAEAIDIEQLTAEHPCQQALFAEGINDGKAVGDGRQVHRQGCDCLQGRLFERTRNTRVMNCVSNDECDCRCQYSAAADTRKLLPSVRRSRCCAAPRCKPTVVMPLSRKGFSEQLSTGGQKYKEQQCDYTKITCSSCYVVSCRVTPPLRSLPCFANMRKYYCA